MNLTTVLTRPADDDVDADGLAVVDGPARVPVEGTTLVSVGAGVGAPGRDADGDGDGDSAGDAAHGAVRGRADHADHADLTGRWGEGDEVRAAPHGVPVGLGLPVVRTPMTPAELEQAAWQDRALCSQTDPEAFFPEKGGSTREAKRVCLGCEVRTECLEYALTHDERFGIWGGLSERERRRVKREAV